MRCGRAGALVLAFGAMALACRPVAPSLPAAPVAVFGGQPSGIRDWINVHTYDRVTAAAKLPPLRMTMLPAGVREVRIWIGGGIGYPQDFYRFSIDRKGGVTGALVFYWPAPAPDTAGGERPGETSHELMIHDRAGSCGTFQRLADMGVCTALFTAPPRWSDVLRRAEAAGLWTLPDESTLPSDGSITDDGWGMTVELRDGSHYRAYRYSNPDMHARWPEAARAMRIAKSLGGIDALIRPSSANRVYRGQYVTGPGLSDFRECGRSERWSLASSSGSITATRPGGPQSDSVVTGATRLYVEVRGILAPEWVSRQRAESPDKRHLDVMEVLLARPWSDADCRGDP